MWPVIEMIQTSWTRLWDEAQLLSSLLPIFIFFFQLCYPSLSFPFYKMPHLIFCAFFILREVNASGFKW